MTTLNQLRSKREQRDSRQAKSNRELATMARALHDEGETWPAIAEALGFSRQALRDFLARHTEGG